MTKVVNEFLIIGPCKNIEYFHASMGLRFKLGSFFIDQELTFNTLHILLRRITLSLMIYVNTSSPSPQFPSHAKTEKNIVFLPHRQKGPGSKP